jgi:DNA-binding GntR family transcriptional regulator
MQPIDTEGVRLEYVHRLDRLSTRKTGSWVPHRGILCALQVRKRQEARLAMANHIDYARDRMPHPLTGAVWSYGRFTL